ncbi:hypothetical protein [Paraburkholderia sediminicola]|uniref:hypothetical protein n=1 Tax=Paraburkholderia sediminicola TaxID=458836 RepID=UPI000F25C11D
MIFDTAGYEGALENDGLPAVHAALKRLDLTGPALVCLALLRLEGAEAGIRHPGTGIIDREPVPGPAATEFIQVDQNDGLSRTALRGPFDRLRQKPGLGPASVEAGTS